MRPRSLIAVLAPLALLASACGGAPHEAAAGPKVVVVGQNFTEADLLTALDVALLDKAGFSARIDKVGARDLYLGPLSKGTVQVATDSLSATTEALNHQKNGDEAVTLASPDVRRTLGWLTTLGRDAGITPLKPTRAEVKSAYAVTKQYAAAHHLRTLSDLGRAHLPVVLAGSPDCAQRDDCAPGLRRTYGITISKVVPLGSGSPDAKVALQRGQAQLAQVATTDTQLDSQGIVVLSDDKHLLAAENLTPLVNTAWLKAHPKAKQALDRLSGVLTTADLRAMAAQVNNRHRSPKAVAQDYLERHDLV